MIFIIFHIFFILISFFTNRRSGKVLRVYFCFGRGLNRPACMVFDYPEGQSFSFAQGNTKGQPWRPCP